MNDQSTNSKCQGQSDPSSKKKKKQKKKGNAPKILQKAATAAAATPPDVAVAAPPEQGTNKNADFLHICLAEPLAEMQKRFSPEHQQEILEAYRHILRTALDTTAMTERRRTELFLRCVTRKAKALGDPSGAAASTTAAGRSICATNAPSAAQNEAPKNIASISHSTTEAAPAADNSPPTKGVDLSHFVKVAPPSEEKQAQKADKELGKSNDIELEKKAPAVVPTPVSTPARKGNSKPGFQILKRSDTTDSSNAAKPDPAIKIPPRMVPFAASPSQSRPAEAAKKKSNQKDSQKQNVNQKQPESQHLRTIQRLKVQLESKTKQSYLILKRNDDLTKLWHAEKYSAKATKERNQAIEDSMHKLQNQMQHKEKLWEAARNDLNRQIASLQEQCHQAQALQQSQQQVQQEEQLDKTKYLETIHAVTKLSQELCLAQQDKRTLEHTLEIERGMMESKDELIQKLRLKLERSELLRPSTSRPSYFGDDNNSRVQALQLELQQTQDKLARALANNSKKKAASSPSIKSKPAQSRDRPSLADFVLGQQEPSGTIQILRKGSTDTADSVGGDTSGGNTGRIRKRNNTVAPPLASAFSMMLEDEEEENEDTRIINSLLDESTACQLNQLPDPESMNAGIRFHGIEEAYDESSDRNTDSNGHTNNKRQDGEDNINEGTGSSASDHGQLDVATEIDFLLASHSEEELIVHADPMRVTRILNLDFDRNDEVLPVHLVLTIPSDGYPETPLNVDVSLAPPSTNDDGNTVSNTVEAQKVAMDALPALLEICRCEAEANASGGTNALFAVLQLADAWVQNEWGGIQAKRLPSDAMGKACLPSPTSSHYQIARWLLSSHHLAGKDKIAFIKSTAHHYGIGGYIKLGYPGYLLLEGLEDNCEFFVQALIQNRAKLRKNAKSSKSGRTDSATFSVAGKTAIKVEDLEAARILPKKQLLEIDKSREGHGCFKEFCQSVDLSQYLLE